MIRSGLHNSVTGKSGVVLGLNYCFINLIWLFAVIFLNFKGEYYETGQALASDGKSVLKVGYQEKHSYRCHGIRFSGGVLINLSLGPDKKWKLHLSHARFNRDKLASTEIRLYAGRKSLKHKMYPFKQVGQDFFIELGNDEKYVTRIAANGWLGYRIGVQKKVKRIRIPDARRMVGEIKKFCSQG